MTDIVKQTTTCKKPGCNVGSWCISSVNQKKTPTTATITNTDNEKAQYIPLDIHKTAIKIGNMKFYFLKKTKENLLVNCQTWKVHKDGPDSKERCSICLENYKHKDTAMKISCNHTFHKACLLKWLQRHQRCPLCQNSVELTVYGEKKESSNAANLRADTLALYSTSTSASSLFFASGYTGYMFWVLMIEF